MALNRNDQPTSPKPLRLWPAAVLATLQGLGLFVLPKILPDQGMYFFFGGIFCALLIVVWWVFLSRAPWSERLGIIALMIVAVFLTKRIVHTSVANAGMGMLFVFYGTPLMLLAFAVAAVITYRLGQAARRAVMVVVILLATGGWALLRLDGIKAAGGLESHWRWTPSAEERLLAQSKDEPAPIAAAPAAAPSAPAGAPAAGEASKNQPAAKAGEKPTVPPSAPAVAETVPEWPGFRGPNRNSIVPGVRIGTDWSASPPVALWRAPIGPAWSSFSVHGDLIYTQEQRGEDEIVSCYKLSTGKPVWRHKDKTRFWEANGGPGPRGTPTLSRGRAYTFGGTGIMNVLDATNGAVVWSRNVANDTSVKVPYWGFASSPLIVDDMVIIAAAGKLAAYDAATGKPRWTGPAGGGGYSSPHLTTIAGVTQVLLLSGTGVIGVAPADGTVLWKHEWPGDGIVQPGLTAEGDILLGAGSGMSANSGMRRIAITHTASGWTAEERWNTIGLKPYFNDFVIHNGHAFGFDGSILSCVDLKDGTRKWKGGRYGNGQLVLLPDQDLLLVLTEEGELALVSATTDQFKELAKFPAIEGKTWNHPVLIGNTLLVRNDREMVAFRMPQARP